MEPEINHESEAQVCADSKSNGSETVTGTRQDLSRASGSSRSAPCVDAAVPLGESQVGRQNAVADAALPGFGAGETPAEWPRLSAQRFSLQRRLARRVGGPRLPAWRSASRDVGGELGHRCAGIDAAIDSSWLAPPGPDGLRGSDGNGAAIRPDRWVDGDVSALWSTGCSLGIRR